MEGTCNKCGLSLCALGIALGLTWGLGVLLMGLLATYANYGVGFVELLGTVYIGLAVGLKGVVIGTLWALVDGFITGVIIAFVYNLVLKKCCKG